MSTRAETVDFVLDVLSPLDVRARAMFGEYALYCDEKVVALVCDDTVFLKPSTVPAERLRSATPAPPFPGAKDWWTLPGDQLEDRDWFQALVQDTADALPVPKPRKKKR